MSSYNTISPFNIQFDRGYNAPLDKSSYFPTETELQKELNSNYNNFYPGMITSVGNSGNGDTYPKIVREDGKSVSNIPITTSFTNFVKITKTEFDEKMSSGTLDEKTVYFIYGDTSITIAWTDMEGNLYENSAFTSDFINVLNSKQTILYDNNAYSDNSTYVNILSHPDNQMDIFSYMTNTNDNYYTIDINLGSYSGTYYLDKNFIPGSYLYWGSAKYPTKLYITNRVIKNIAKIKLDGGNITYSLLEEKNIEISENELTTYNISNITGKLYESQNSLVNELNKKSYVFTDDQDKSSLTYVHIKKFDDSTILGSGFYDTLHASWNDGHILGTYTDNDMIKQNFDNLIDTYNSKNKSHNDNKEKYNKFSEDYSYLYNYSYDPISKNFEELKKKYNNTSVSGDTGSYTEDINKLKNYVTTYNNDLSSYKDTSDKIISNVNSYINAYENTYYITYKQLYNTTEQYTNTFNSSYNTVLNYSTNYINRYNNISTLFNSSYKPLSEKITANINEEIIMDSAYEGFKTSQENYDERISDLSENYNSTYYPVYNKYNTEYNSTYYPSYTKINDKYKTYNNNVSDINKDYNNYNTTYEKYYNFTYNDNTGYYNQYVAYSNFYNVMYSAYGDVTTQNTYAYNLSYYNSEYSIRNTTYSNLNNIYNSKNSSITNGITSYNKYKESYDFVVTIYDNVQPAYISYASTVDNISSYISGSKSITISNAGEYATIPVDKRFVIVNVYNTYANIKIQTGAASGMEIQVLIINKNINEIPINIYTYGTNIANIPALGSAVISIVYLSSDKFIYRVLSRKNRDYGNYIFNN